MAFFTEAERGTITELQILVTIYPEKVLDRTIGISLSSDRVLDVYLVNRSSYSEKMSATGIVAIRSWINTTNLQLRFHDRGDYFPLLVVFNLCDSPALCMGALSQEVTVIRSNYGAAFEGLQIAVCSLVVFSFIGVHRRIGAYMLAERILTRVAPRKYIQYLKIDYAIDRPRRFPCELLLFWLLAVPSVVVTEWATITPLRDLGLSEQALQVTRSWLYNRLVIMLTAWACFVLASNFLWDLLYYASGMPFYSMFKSPDDYHVYGKSSGEAFGRAFGRRKPFLILSPVVGIASGVLLLSFIFPNPPNLSIMRALLFVVIMPLLICMWKVTTDYQVELFAHVDPLKVVTRTRASICCGAIAGGTSICVGFLSAYYLFPWGVLQHQLLGVNPSFALFSYLTGLVLSLVWLAPIILLIYYLGLCLLVVKYLPEENQRKSTVDYVRGLVVTTVTSFLLATVLRLFFAASQLEGDPVRVIATAAGAVFDIDAILTSAAVALAAVLFKDYFSLLGSVGRLSDK
jgi:hypothetical protein